jgi:hypothetical protein
MVPSPLGRYLGSASEAERRGARRPVGRRDPVPAGPPRAGHARTAQVDS